MLNCGGICINGKQHVFSLIIFWCMSDQLFAPPIMFVDI